MQAWAKDQGVEDDSLITLMGDPLGELTRELDLEMTAEGPRSVGIVGRSKRFALYVVDGIVKIVRVAERMTIPPAMITPTLPSPMP